MSYINHQRNIEKRLKRSLEPLESKIGQFFYLAGRADKTKAINKRLRKSGEKRK